MKRNIHLLVIDPQNDFCDLPTDYKGSEFGGASRIDISPALPVNGAHADMQRLGEFISRGVKGLSDISVTLDSHHFLGIERPAFWMDENGADVPPFTEITALQVRQGKFLPRHPQAVSRVLSYLDALEAQGRYKLMIWPVHCEIGTWGHAVHQDVRSAYHTWERLQLGVVNKVTKGSNPWTEHYSALMAEVPDPTDPSTQMNTSVITALQQSDLLIIAGEAGSHCVKATTEHIIDNFGQKSLSNIVLLTDCISPVAGFETQYNDFLKEVQAKGCSLAKSTDLLPDVLSNK